MPNFNKNDFSGNPVRLDAPRSRFAMPFKHKTTFEAGKLIPIFSYGDVLPGDTFKVDLSCLVRMSTPIFPTMDDAYLDVYFFFTPHKLTLSRAMMSPAVNDSNHSWAAFIGAQDSLLNMPTPGDVQLPWVAINGQKSSGDIKTELGSLADYLGLGLTQGGHGISCLEPLAYYSIWNSYFRDENTENPVCYSIGAVTAQENPDLGTRSVILLSGFDGQSYRWGARGLHIGNKDSILPVCRPHGYFGSALPWPQRNINQVEIPLLGSAPVVDAAGHAGNVGDPYDFYLTGDALYADDDPILASGGALVTSVKASGSEAASKMATTLLPNVGGNHGLYADLTNAPGIAVNQLRLLVQTQRFYEALARGGNRIGEMTATMFGVTPSDYAQDRPEYLGGKRIPISMDQVANTAGPNPNTEGETQTLGSLGAYSNTGDSSFYFEKSFDTWGTITCVVCVRTNETFSQGIARRYTRKDRLSFFWPQFANLGEQPILKKELYIGNSYDSTEQEVFGYQEAWAEYRYLPDIVSGYLRPDQSLGAYTYSNYFESSPTLAGYIKGGDNIAANVDRTLVAPRSSAGFQFIGDFSFNIVATRPMPRYSIPGLVDHH